MRSDRFLICLKTYLGDAVMASPMIEALERGYEDVTVQTSPLVQKLLQDPIRSRRFIPFEKSRAPWATVRTAMALRRERYSTAVLVNRSFRIALVTTLAGIRTRVGHAKEGRGAFVTKVVPYDENRFEAETCLDLARALGCDGPGHPTLPIGDGERSEGKSLLQGATIGIQPGTRYEGKQIPLPVLAEVAGSLQQHGHRVVLLGGPEEVELGNKLQSLLPTQAYSLIGKTDIRRTLGVLSNLRLAIGGDTGLMHMAAAAECPTVTVFGPTNHQKWGHHYEPHHVVIAPEGDMGKVTVSDLLDPTRIALVF